MRTSFHKYHRNLAHYFQSKHLFPSSSSLQSPNIRKLVEQPWQQINSNLWSELETTSLCNLEFIDAKVVANEVRDLIFDYSNVEIYCEDIVKTIPSWEEWKYFVLNESHTLEKHIEGFRQILFQQAFNSSRDGKVSLAAKIILDKNRYGFSYWFERINRPLFPAINGLLFTLTGHTAEVYTVCISQEGNYIVSGSADKTIRIWDTMTGTCMNTLKGHNSTVFSVCIIKDLYILSASWDHTIRIWDLQTGECLKIFTDHTAPITFIKVLDSDRFFSGSFDSTIRIWSFSAQACLAVLSGHQKTVNFAIQIGNNLLASASNDSTIRIWDIENARCIKVIIGHIGAVTHLTHIPDFCLISSSQDGTIRLWSIESGECLQTLRGHNGPVIGTMQILHDRLLSWSFDYTIRIWSITNGECLKIIDDHDDPIMSVIKANNQIYISCSQDKTARLWKSDEFNAGTILRGHINWINAIEANSKGILVTASSDATLKVWNWNTASLKYENVNNNSAFVPEIFLARYISGIEFLEKTKAVSRTYFPDTFQIWDLEKGKCLEIVNVDSSLGGELKKLFDNEFNGGMSFMGSSPGHDIWKPSIGLISIGTNSLSIGVGCLLIRSSPHIKGAWEHSIISRALYPLSCEACAKVYDSEFTIAFEKGTREAHILKLHYLHL